MMREEQRWRMPWTTFTKHCTAAGYLTCFVRRRSCNIDVRITQHVVAQAQFNILQAREPRLKTGSTARSRAVAC